MRVLIIISFILVRYISFAQDPSLERMIEDLSAREEQVGYEEDLQQMQHFRRRPLRINEADAEMLSVFPFLTPVQIEQFMLYRSLLGPLTEVYELQAVPYWDGATIRRLMPFIVVEPPGTAAKRWGEQWRKAEQQLLVRFTSSTATMLRYQRKSDYLGINLVVEKDAGEKWWQGKKGVAFVSGHISLRGRGWVREWIIGDYLVNLGQGLVLWQGRGLYKNSASVMVKKQRALVQPYRSTDENRFMRGTALLLGKGHFQGLAFGSSHRVDANLMIDSATRIPHVSSLLYSGLHRSDAEWADRDALAVVSGGVAAQFQKDQLTVGLHAVHHQLEFPMLKRAEPYNLYALKGKHVNTAGIQGSYGWGGVHAFGELAWSNGQVASLAGMMMALHKNLDLALLYRNAGRAYHAWGASAFTEGAEVNNEEGMYVGLSWRISQVLTMDAYTDRFRFPWLRYGVNSPSEGFEHLVQITWRPNKQTRLFCRFSQLEKAENESAPAILRKSLSTGRSAFRFHLERTLDNRWEWRARVELSSATGADGSRANGFMTYLECHWLWKFRSLAGNVRWGFFDVSDYSARIYAYEADVMYYSTIPANFGKGMQAYFNIRWPVNDKLNIYLKCSNVWKGGVANSYIRGQIILYW